MINGMPEPNFGKRWYIVQTYSGYENAVKADIERRAETMGLTDCIFRIIVPEETKIHKKVDGTEKKEVKKIFPGYVFIEMIVTDESWFMVRNTPKVTGFLGSSGGGTKPVPLREDEIKGILLKEGLIAKAKYDYLLNQNVNIIEGSFQGMSGVVTKVDNEREIVLVNISMFGRMTPTELAISSISEAKNNPDTEELKAEPSATEDINEENTEEVKND